MSLSGFEKKLVEALRKNSGRYLDESGLLGESGPDPAAGADCDIQGAVESLRMRGYGIDGDEVRGWRLTEPPDMLQQLELDDGLGTSFLGKTLFTYRIIGSTSETAGMLAESGAPDGSLIVAEEQSDGKGRYSNSWYSPPGTGIWASLILRPGIAPSRLGSLGMLASLCICLALEEQTGLAPGIKWPNDIVLDGRKCAGILIESGLMGSSLRHAVLSFGLNVNVQEFPPELAGKATSLSLAANGRFFDRVPILRAILNHLEEGYFRFMADGFASFLPRVLMRDFLKNRQVIVERPGSAPVSGTARGIDQGGALLVECNDGMVRVENGHVASF